MLQSYRCVITHDSLLLFSFVCSILSKIPLYWPAHCFEFASLGRNSKVSTVWSLVSVQKSPTQQRPLIKICVLLCVNCLPTPRTARELQSFPGDAAARSHTASFEREHEESFSLE